MLRIHLSGRTCIESDGVRLGSADFPGRQGRAAFTLLATERGRPVSRSTLVDALWPAGPPRSCDAALNSIISKLRGLLTRAGVDGAACIAGTGGCFELTLPEPCWIDYEAAASAIHLAEAALQAGDPGTAYGHSAVAHHIARRPFLAGEEAPWIDERREKLASILIRALECRAEVYLWNDEITLAVEAAREMVVLRPWRESGYRLLMRAHVAAGNTAEALNVYDSCRSLIAEEFGVGPSAATRAVHAGVLASL